MDQKAKSRFHSALPECSEYEASASILPPSCPCSFPCPPWASPVFIEAFTQENYSQARSSDSGVLPTSPFCLNSPPLCLTAALTPEPRNLLRGSEGPHRPIVHSLNSPLPGMERISNQTWQARRTAVWLLPLEGATQPWQPKVSFLPELAAKNNQPSHLHILL